jgi:hypothetical protein
MATRVRSPNYPALGLGEAISKIERVFAKEQHLPAPRDVMAQHMGYSSLNGSSLKALSALLKYGLLEKTKDDKRKVSALAMKILHPRTAEEKAAAIREAASRPALFANLAKEWENGAPSDANLKAYLINQHYSLDAIPEVIKAFRDTAGLVASVSGLYPPTPEETSSPTLERKSMQPQVTKEASNLGRQTLPLPQDVRSENREPFKITFTASGIDVAGRIVTAQDAEEFVNAINALKMLLRPPTISNGHTLEEEE